MSIFRCTFGSKKNFFFFFPMLLVFFSMGCTSASYAPFYSGNGYVVLVAQSSSETDVRWSKYLYEHMKKRAVSPNSVAYASSENEDMYGITLKLDSGLSNDFEVERNGTNVFLNAKSEKTMLWLIYQLIKRIGTEDSRIVSSDLPPSLLSFADTCGVFPFDYREAYFPENLVPEMAPLYGNNCVDTDWSLWGHNLKKALDEKGNDVFAKVGGAIDKSQYCFSSPFTYASLEQYVLNQAGSGETFSSRFAIFPNDNEVACTCPKCKALGNTDGCATPAVTFLIRKLAARFPHHSFFTSSYLTTDAAPSASLPDNVGVIVGAMDLPLRANMEELPKSKKFINRVNGWKAVAKRVYVWDYVSNFDDYLSPFPVLKLAQERLQLYKKIGVNGVFFNGSGYDYSSFSGLHTFVLSALMINPSYSVDSLVSTYFKEFYPSFAADITNYYSSLESRAVSQGKRLNIYGGIADAERTHLDAYEFVRFYDSLSSAVRLARGDERKRLQRLHTALSFTRLEIARNAAYSPLGVYRRDGHSLSLRTEIPKVLAALESHKALGFSVYREDGGSLEAYISSFRTYIAFPERENLLLGQTLTAVSPLDEGYEDTGVLTDGVSGLPSDYHQGWMINSYGSLVLKLPESAKRGTLRLSFLSFPRHKIVLPSKIEVLSDDRVINTFSPPQVDSNLPYSLSQAVCVLPSALGSITLRIVAAEGRKSKMACSEIQLNP